MALPTHTPTLDQVFTRYAYNKIGGRKYKDQKYKTRPLLRLLRERKVNATGGPNIVHPVNLGTTANGKSLSRNETFSIEGDANETWARYTPKVVIETCFVSWWDIRESSPSKFKMQTILDSRIDETRENLEDTIAGYLAQSSAAATTDVTPILTLVKTTGAAGGLNPATAGQSAWAAQNEDTINWSVEGIGRTREGINTVEDNKGNLTVILLPDAMFNETCEVADSALVLNQDIKTKGGTKYADLGTKVPLILNTPVIRDNIWNSNQTATGVGLDMDGIHLTVDPRWDMYMWPFKEMVHHGRLGQASVKITVCELTMSSRRTQLLLSTLS